MLQSPWLALSSLLASWLASSLLTPLGALSRLLTPGLASSLLTPGSASSLLPPCLAVPPPLPLSVAPTLLALPSGPLLPLESLLCPSLTLLLSTLLLPLPLLLPLLALEVVASSTAGAELPRPRPCEDSNSAVCRCQTRSTPPVAVATPLAPPSVLNPKPSAPGSSPAPPWLMSAALASSRYTSAASTPSAAVIHLSGSSVKWGRWVGLVVQWQVQGSCQLRQRPVQQLFTCQAAV